MIRKYLAEIILLICSLIVFIVVFNLSEKSDLIIEEEVVIPEPELMFGLPVDSFSISEGKIKRNQNLSDILTGFGIDLGTIDKLARSSRDTFDVRKIVTGRNYYVFQSLDSLKKPEYFIYESSGTDYIVFELNDSLHVFRGKKNIVSDIRTASSVIESSLWNAMVEQNVNPVLANELSDIYQWTIDFFAIQKGDKFRVIFDEDYVDSIPIGIGKIHAAQFRYMGKDFYAFRYRQDTVYDYIDEEGKNLRKAFLKAPLSFSRISGRFTYNRMHPILRYRRPHLGVDYVAPKGTPVKSIGEGVVISKAYQKGGGGNYLRIRHNSVYTTTYMHLSGYAKGIAPGVHVEQGQVIGYVGATGLASGPHLDFRITKNGKPTDPLKVEAPPGDSIRDENLNTYFIFKDSMMNELNKINWEQF
ncbi:MAG: peptidoglycan DD-metalloendopeptidase family protein [Prolixibacteraceae bacterium]|nr:peptidoglycan DD-metalloendopeptidase family protein [Prolixibacteraceae bacterium]MBN2773282.1 peptidoglycan DD-metalloendopeptidase family protein [Prolixibacteraceae bacterium]